MIRNMDTIKFDSRAEISDLLNAVERYVKEHPEEKNNQSLKTFYDLLYTMEMDW